jgi:quaternary ammonium compound-resistance protein SugE
MLKQRVRSAITIPSKLIALLRKRRANVETSLRNDQRCAAARCNASHRAQISRRVEGSCAMNAWLALLAAGLLEVGWALGLKYSDGLTRFWPTVATFIAIALSFALMALALRSLPFGTAYAVWTGIGAVGSILVGMLLYSEPTDPVRIICLILIVAGMIGLKLNSPA